MNEEEDCQLWKGECVSGDRATNSGQFYCPFHKQTRALVLLRPCRTGYFPGSVPIINYLTLEYGITAMISIQEFFPTILSNETL